MENSLFLNPLCRWEYRRRDSVDPDPGGRLEDPGLPEEAQVCIAHKDWMIMMQ